MADGLLIMGTSLEVYSAWRFVKRAVEKELPIVLVNQGETRLDRIHPKSIRYRVNDNSSKFFHDVTTLLLR